jgi:hypothetical protein
MMHFEIEPETVIVDLIYGGIKFRMQRTDCGALTPLCHNTIIPNN